MEKSIIVLVSAHFIADFLLQPDWLYRSKVKWWGIPLHALIVAATAYLLLQQWTAWAVPLLLFVSHGITDFIKTRSVDTWRSFCVDQLAHLFLLGGIAWLGLGRGWMMEFNGAGISLMVLVAGFIATVHGAGYLVGKVAAQLQEENDLAGSLSGLANGGKLIGQLERALIFLLVLMGQPGGIGFLVAAKSILRFSEAKESQKLAEYVLIGTLLSFGLAIAAATLTRTLVRAL